MKFTLMLFFIAVLLMFTSCHTAKATANTLPNTAVSDNPSTADAPKTDNAINVNNPTAKIAEEFSVDCLDKTTAQPDIICDEDNRPVCGCNNVNYKNACEATKVGLKYYSWGKCPKTIKRGAK